MAETVEVTIPADQGTPKEVVSEDNTPVLFPEVSLLKPCSELVCRNGHSWSPSLALAKCGYGTPQGWMGCGTPILAVQMQQCPTCNEPTDRFRLRIEHTPPTPYPTPVCIPGSKSHAEIVMVEIPFRHYLKPEQAAQAPSVENQSKEEKNNGKAV